MVYYYFISYFAIWTLFILMTLSIYRFKLSTYWKQAVIIGSVMTPFSVFFHYHALNLIGPLQVILMIGFIWYVFKISIGYATIMTISGYIITGLPDLFVDWFYERFLGVENVPAVPQSVSIVVFCLAVIYICTRFRLGFSFVPTHKRGKPIALNKANSKIILALVLAFVWVIVGTVVSTQELGVFYLFLGLIIILILLAILLKQQYNKDLED